MVNLLLLLPLLLALLITILTPSTTLISALSYILLYSNALVLLSLWQTVSLHPLLAALTPLGLLHSDLFLIVLTLIPFFPLRLQRLRLSTLVLLSLDFSFFLLFALSFPFLRSYGCFLSLLRLLFSLLNLGPFGSLLL